MSFRRIFSWPRFNHIRSNYFKQTHPNIPIGIGTWLTVSTTSSFYCLSASTIEPVSSDDHKPKKRRLRRRKKKQTDTIDTNETVKESNDNAPSHVDRINGHYQNRIRQLSTPEKIFSTFASTVNKKTGQQMMTFNDFCEAILPYDFRNESAAANMKNQSNRTDNIPHFLSEIICDKKLKFSMNLSEFIFLTSLLSIPPSDFEFVFKIFDLDGNGMMDAKEFKFLLEHFKQKNTSNYSVTDDNIIKKTQIWKYLFGIDEDKQLTLEQFQSFLFDLRESICRVEYERYTGSTDKKLSPKNFGMSLVSYAHHSQISYYVARVNRLPKSRFSKQQCSITYDEFVAFNKCLYSINDIMRALSYYKAGKENITQTAFHHTVKCITGIDLNKQLIRVMFWVLDRDEDNTLDQNEISGLLTERFQYGQAADRVFLGNVFKCFRECVSG